MKGNLVSDCRELREAVLDGDDRLVRRLTERAIAEGTATEEILSSGLVAAMEEVGERFVQGEYFIPDMLLSARAMYEGLNLIRPLLAADGIAARGKAVIGTVKGDIHDIGKNVLLMMLEGAGFQMVDLGVNVTPEQFVAAVEAERPDFVLMSALITNTMPAMGDTIQALQQAGVRDRLVVGVGGAPITAQFADAIGADFYAPDASRAVFKIKALVER